MLTKPRRELIDQLLSGSALTSEGNTLFLDGAPQNRRANRLIKDMVDDGYLTFDGSRYTPTHSAIEAASHHTPIKPRARARGGAPQTDPLTIYLGIGDVARERRKRIEQIAEPFGGRSKMIQQIADGDLLVIENPNRSE